MKLIQSEIPDVIIIEPTIFDDDRGWFFEAFNEPLFHKELALLNCPIPRPFIQDNHSNSKKNVLRGLHYQMGPHAQGKLVRVISGAVFDVVVDIRKGSLTYGKWFGIELSAINQKMLWIPEGFAHGFVALEDNTQFLYKTTDVYSQKSERSIRWNDPELAIEWPISESLIVSKKDQEAPFFAEIGCSAESLKGSTESHELAVLGDERGSLIALEQGQNIPFEIRRAYYIFNTKKDVSRGFHAHYRLQQYIVCVSGRCRILTDDGITVENTWLDTPNKALHVKNLVWREMHDFSEDCVLLVFASDHYKELDYIRNYSDFKAAVKRYA